MVELNHRPIQTSPSPYVNTKQAAKYLGLSHQYLEIARHKGDGPQYIKLAKAVRYRLEDLDDWMKSHTQKHTADTCQHRFSSDPIDKLGHNSGPPLDDAVTQRGPSVSQKKLGGKNG